MKIKLSELKEIAKAATPQMSVNDCLMCTQILGRSHADILFMVAANPQAVLALIDDLEKAREALEEMSRWDIEFNLISGPVLGEKRHDKYNIANIAKQALSEMKTE